MLITDNYCYLKYNIECSVYRTSNFTYLLSCLKKGISVSVLYINYIALAIDPFVGPRTPGPWKSVFLVQLAEALAGGDRQ